MENLNLNMIFKEGEDKIDKWVEVAIFKLERSTKNYLPSLSPTKCNWRSSLRTRLG